MRLGLVHINMGSMSQPDAVARAAQAAESAGFDSVWAGEHIVLAPETPDGPAQTIEAGLAAISGL